MKEDLTIKIKLKSKLNPNFIKILGRVDINLGKLTSKDCKQNWFELHNNKDVVNNSQTADNMLSIGKIKIGYTFYETSSKSVSIEQDSVDYSNDSYELLNNRQLLSEGYWNRTQPKIEIKEIAGD